MNHLVLVMVLICLSVSVNASMIVEIGVQGLSEQNNFKFNSENISDLERRRKLAPLKDDERKMSFSDTFDYSNHSLCGDLEIGLYDKCRCNNITFKSVYRDTQPIYCCVPPGGDKCYKDDDGIGYCPGGQLIAKDQPCHGGCYNTWQTSAVLWASHYHCPERCTHITYEWCQGIGYCGSDVQDCNEDIRCVGYGTKFHGIAKIQSINTELVEDHYFCNVETLTNNGFYDTIARADETSKYSKENNEDSIDMTKILKPCDSHGIEKGGILCPKTSKNNETCYPNYFWCNDGPWIGQCNVEIGGSVIRISFNNQQVCGNHTFWKDFSTDTIGQGTIFVTEDIKRVDRFGHLHNDEGPIWTAATKRKELRTDYHRGKRCSGPKQHVHYNWYGSLEKEVPFNLPTNCRDKSDQVFPSNKSCKEFNQKYIEEYISNFCKNEKCRQEATAWFSNQTDPKITDPHNCMNSCANPDQNCMACSNTVYFRCHKSDNMCIHPSLHCDGHPQCPQAEDEDNCYDDYVRKKIVKPYATYKCRSVLYEEIETVATVCNNVVECYDGADESFCSGTSLPTIIVVSTASSFVLLYITLKIWRFLYVRSKTKPATEINCLDKVFEDFERNSYNKKIVEGLNEDLLQIMCNTKKKEYEKIFRKVFNIVAKLHDYNESRTYSYLHQNFSSILNDKILSTKYPGIDKTAMEYLREKLKKFRKEYLGNLLYKLHYEDYKLKYQAYVRMITRTIRRIITIEFEYMDIFKDIAFAISTLSYVGGPQAIYDYPYNFTSVIVVFFFASIVTPIWIATFELATNNAGLIFLQTEEKLTPLKKVGYRVLNFVFCFFNPILLANSEDIYEERFLKATRSNCNNATKKLKIYQKCQLQVATYRNIDLGLEVYYQILVQLMLVLLAQSETPTVEGLQAMFNQKTNIFGIELSAVTFLVLSIAWSLKSCIFVGVKEIEAEKAFMPLTSKLTAILWSTFGVLRRVLTMTSFFIPCLGFFSILHHHKTEQIPFKARLEYAEKFVISPEDKIELRGLEKTVFWSDLDRWNYTDPKYPNAPDYTIYTGLSLKHYFFAYLGISLVHFLALLVAKFFTARKFRNCVDKTRKFIHLLKNQNFSIPYIDWDNILSDGTIDEYRKQFRDIKFEMYLSLFINTVFSFTFLFPLYYTVSQINSRHIFLKSLIGTKEEEDYSYENANSLLWTTTCLFFLFSVLEVVFFYLYNNKYHPWISIINGTDKTISKEEDDEDLAGVSQETSRRFSRALESLNASIRVKDWRKLETIIDESDNRSNENYNVRDHN